MITIRTSQVPPWESEAPPERRFFSVILIGMSFLALAGCTSTVVSLAALH